MASLIDRFLQRSGERLSPQDIDRLSALAADERSKMVALLRQAEAKSQVLADAHVTVQAFEDRLAELTAEQQRLQKRIADAGDLGSLLTALETRSHQIDQLARRTEERVEGIAQKNEAAERASRNFEGLLETSREAERRIADFQSHSRELTALEEKVRSIQEWLEHFENRTRSVNDDYKNLTRTAEGLRTEIGRFEETAEGITRDLSQAKEMAGGIEDMLSGLATAKSLARKSEEQLHKLNALSEHVTQKTQSLAATQQALERAEVQSRQANELVRGIEERVQKVAEESRLVQSSEDQVESLTRIHRDLVERLEATGRHRQEAERSSSELTSKIGAAVNRIEEGLAHSAMLREQVDLANQRVRELATAVGRQQRQLDELAARDQEVVQGRKNADALLARLQEIESLVGGLEAKSTDLATLEERLAGLDESSARVDERMQSVADQRALVERVGSRLDELSALYDETRNRLESLAEGRQEVEQAVAFLAEFRQTRAEAEGRIQEVSRRLDEVDRVHAHLLKLQKLAHDLEGRTTELEPRLDFVQGVEGRLNRLDELSQAIDMRLEEQLGRQGELESMRLAQEGLQHEITDLKKLAASLQSSPQLREMEGRVKDLERRLEIFHRMLERTESLESTLIEGETRVGSLGERAEALEQRVGHQEGKLERIAQESRRAHELRESWKSEARTVEQRQRELRESSQSLVTEVQQVKGSYAELEERWQALREREATVARYEGKIQELEEGLGTLDRKIDLVNSRQGLVDRIKRDVDGIYDTCDQSRRSAAEVIASRKSIADARQQMDELGSQAANLETKMARLRGKLEGVEEAEYKIDALSNILDDLTINLETFREQKAVIDHVAAKLGQIDFEIKRAELVTQSLRDERQLASRIHDGIQALRASKTKKAAAASAAPLTLLKRREPSPKVEVVEKVREETVREETAVGDSPA